MTKNKVAGAAHAAAALLCTAILARHTQGNLLFQFVCIALLFMNCLGAVVRLSRKD